jgi:hypothetical protein
LFFANNKLTLEGNDRIDHTKQQAHTTEKKRREEENKSKMNAFSRYTFIWFKVEKSAHMML